MPTIIYTPGEAKVERDRLEAVMLHKYGTNNLSALIELTFSGLLDWEEVAEVERFETFCYFAEDWPTTEAGLFHMEARHRERLRTLRARAKRRKRAATLRGMKKGLRIFIAGSA